MFRSLPEGAQVTKATVTVNPVTPPGGMLFEETISFTGEKGTWGAQKREGSTKNGATLLYFVEVDFHARRTLSAVAGNDLDGAELQVDIGGLYVPINVLGAMSTPDDGAEDFSLSDDVGGLLPALATQKFKLTKNSQPTIENVDIRSTPSNLTLHLGSQPSLWARPGDLARQETIPDFSVILNAFLTEAIPKDGYYEIPFTLHSDTLCRLDVEIALEYVQKQSALPGGVSEAALTFDYSTLSQGEDGVISAQLPAGAQVIPGQTTGRIRGSFANSRVVYGPTGKVDAVSVVNVTPDRYQASPLIFSEKVALTSLDLLLTSTSRTAELTVDLVEDLDGKPGTQSALPAQVKVGIDSQIAGKPTWVNVALPVEVQVKAGSRVWLVVQSLNGEVAWSVVTQSRVEAGMVDGSWTAGGAVAIDQANGSALGILYTDTGGLSWRKETASGITGPLAGMIHLRQPSTGYQVPIALQVGDGNAAQRVSLDRFRPLGRVDFNLDFAEFAEAINQAASASAVTTVPSGEHLLNNEFETWQRVGDTPRETAMIVPSGSGVAQGLALGPNGNLLYIANSSRLAIVNTTCHKLEKEISLDDANFEGLAVSPDGRRACILQDDQMTWVDLETRNLMGKPAYLLWTLEKSLFSLNPVFSPNGDQLFLMSYLRTPSSQIETGVIQVYDVAQLEAAFLAGSGIANTLVNTIEIGNHLKPVAQAICPDGSQLFVVIEDDYDEGANAELLVYSLPSKTLIIKTAVGNGREFSLALNPDGSRAVIANYTNGGISVFETRRGQKIASISTEGKGQPRAVAVEPGGRYAYAVLERYDQPNVVTRFDISRPLQGFLNPVVEICKNPSDLVILPSGERLYVADTGTCASNQVYCFSALALGAMVPEEWTLTSGIIQPICVEEPFHRGAVLGDFAPSLSGYHMPPGIIPKLLIQGVVHNNIVTIKMDNFPANETFIVTMGRMCTLGIDGVIVETQATGNGGTFTATYNIPPELANSYQIAFRLESPTSGYFAYNWFYNDSTRAHLPSAISQVVPVVGGVHYDLNFWGLATTNEALAEVIWYGGNCGVQQTDRVPFHQTDNPENLKCTLQTLIDMKVATDVDSFTPVSHRLAMTSPEDAELAEVRFIAPANQAAFFDRVSLQASSNTLANGDFKHLDGNQLVGWTLTPGGAAGITLIAEADGLRIRNNGTCEAAVEQSTSFPPEVPYTFNYTGRVDVATRNTPRLEIVWLDSGKARLGAINSTSIPTQGSNQIVRRGISPVGTVFALLRVVVPSGADLLLQSIQLEEVKMTTVPIYVIAQAPGDIQISRMQVAYEIKLPSPPKALPPSGLCTPTPPPGIPGNRNRGCCYCPNCGETDDLCNTEEMETSGGQPALEGECCHCGARVQQIGGGSITTSVSAAPKGTTPVVARKTEMVRGQTALRANAVRAIEVLQAKVIPMNAEIAVASPKSIQAKIPTSVNLNVVAKTATTPAITAVTRVTAEIAEALTVGGFGILDRLAEATPSEIAAVLPESLKAEAKYISRNARNLLKRAATVKI